MDIVFANARLEQACASLGILRELLGDRSAKSAAAQIASLRAASCLDEFRHLPGRCRERSGRLVLQLSGGGVLLLEPADGPQSTSTDGALEWQAIRSVRILEISPRDTRKKG